MEGVLREHRRDESFWTTVPYDPSQRVRSVHPCVESVVREDKVRVLTPTDVLSHSPSVGFISLAVLILVSLSLLCP